MTQQASRWRVGSAGVVMLGLILTACGGAKVGDSSTAADNSSGPCGTFNIAVNPWVGYAANVAVVSYLLKHELGCEVVERKTFTLRCRCPIHG